MTDMEVVRAEVAKLVPRLSAEIKPGNTHWLYAVEDDCKMLFRIVTVWTDAKFGRRFLTWNKRPFIALHEVESPLLARRFYYFASDWWLSQSLGVAEANVSYALKHGNKKEVAIWLPRLRQRVKELQTALERLAEASIEIEQFADAWGAKKTDAQ